jgi:hypothetical protein
MSFDTNHIHNFMPFELIINGEAIEGNKKILLLYANAICVS